MATKTTKKSKEDVKGMKPGDLEKNLANLREEMRVIKWKAEGSKSKNVKELASLKKQIARILTRMNTKEA